MNLDEVVQESVRIYTSYVELLCAAWVIKHGTAPSSVTCESNSASRFRRRTWLAEAQPAERATDEQLLLALRHASELRGKWFAVEPEHAQVVAEFVDGRLTVTVARIET